MELIIQLVLAMTLSGTLLIGLLYYMQPYFVRPLTATVLRNNFIPMFNSEGEFSGLLNLDRVARLRLTRPDLHNATIHMVTVDVIGDYEGTNIEVCRGHRSDCIAYLALAQGFRWTTGHLALHYMGNTRQRPQQLQLGD